mmetsp:Transcript_32876/g.55903  ORF Transcript_32876/g.55903 Transcript_32876/m.55903 type:complete len:263 (+) Transcript_32876:149-937(+)|eukprot:CAMPEP_0183714828 /NCGR_PEP_ID=MMETSP0737-20130205/9252_1 /TAXON_ID=385413 /ORGANISM="Thalassiosira miniscula, Strain CCMP1093" /LENGTH=262 /DNA_ID=CAMNT_0025943833 /DNA_START=128 /DNA_END=916 /DNA_ORIENTATION=-
MAQLSLLVLTHIVIGASAFTAPNSNHVVFKMFPRGNLQRPGPGENPIVSPRLRTNERKNILVSFSSATEFNNGPVIEDYESIDNDDNPVKSAGLSFVSASSKSLGMLFYNIGGMDHKEVQASLLQVGTHLVSAGESWSTDWDAVRESMASAAAAFYDISDVFGSANIDESMPLGTLFENIGKELEDISEISGCCAVGPPCSVPNLLAVEEHLIEVSKILKKNSVAATDEHMMCTLFKEVAELFGEMAGRYVDNDGQKSEVSL